MMGAFIVLLGLALFALLIINLAVNKREYSQFGIGYSVVLILGGLSLGAADGFGLGSIIIAGIGIFSLAAFIILSRIK
jgi:hypothetical protein